MGDLSSLSSATFGLSEKISQASPSRGLDLILGAAAAGRSRLTAIKLGISLKMLGMNGTWRCQRRGGGGGGGEGASSSMAHSHSAGLV